MKRKKQSLAKKNKLSEIKKARKKSKKKEKPSVFKNKVSNLKSEIIKGADPKTDEKVLEPKDEKPKLNITENKIIKMLDFAHLEELFHLLNLLDDKQAGIFLEHYKKLQTEKNVDPKLDKIVKSAANKSDLLASIRKVIVTQFKDEIENLRREITDKRKKGTDVFVEDLQCISATSKIKMFEATSSKEDYYKIKKILFDVKESLNKKSEKK